MTDQEINRAVAESVSASFGCLVVIQKDYCNSYDAIMPLVKALKGMQRNRFADHLFKAVFPNTYIQGWMFTHMMHEYITATPRQLCEAYLRTVGKWSEA
jgi:hypothetical protein